MDNTILKTHKIIKPIFKNFQDVSDNLNKKNQTQNKQLADEIGKEAEKIRQEAYKIGFDKGLKDAQEKNKKEIGNVLCMLKNVYTDLGNKEEKILQNMEPQILEMIMQISQKIIQQELSVNKEVLINILRSLLKKIKDKTEITVKICSEDYKYLSGFKDVLISENPDLKKINFESASEIKRGDFIIETKTELIDASIEKQIEELRTVLGISKNMIQEVI